MNRFNNPRAHYYLSQPLAQTFDVAIIIYVVNTKITAFRACHYMLPVLRRLLRPFPDILPWLSLLACAGVDLGGYMGEEISDSSWELDGLGGVS